ncbi:ATP-binding protein [Lolliginicoccus suaedae]|uniref:ATP-binding protein n=1 Tax=Lolliginicoccus suaedae TaxID=2605429 RepID=UPI0011EFA53F|nr:ATP-binding protein [Lolliginicoccus suaedae]
MIAKKTTTAPEGVSVDIAIRADIHYLPVFREIVKSVGKASGLVTDDIDDMQLAVDEIATTLIEIAATGSEVTCSIEDNGAALCVTMTAECAAAPLPRTNSFRWHVVRTLADDLDWHQDAHMENHGRRNGKCPSTTVQVVKRKALPVGE